VLLSQPTGCATRRAHQMKWLWAFVYNIHDSHTKAERLCSCQQASDIIEVACEVALYNIPRLLYAPSAITLE